jgi:hypothetical protein
MKSIVALTLVPAIFAFAPRDNGIPMKTALKASAIGADKTLYDPLGLYPANSPERKAGIIKPLETFSQPTRAVTDPLGIYPSNQSELSSSAEMSASVPFLTRPAHLDGSLPGDRGFDPFNFAAEEGSLDWYRKSELKHARIAMLAAVGWPIAELFHGKIADSIGFPSLLASGDRVPSVLNDGLAHAPFAEFWIPAIALATALEFSETFAEDEVVFDNGKAPTSPFVKEAEIFNGRLAMLAITGFAIQEFLFQEAVVNQFPIFFKPINIALEQLMNAGGSISL